VSQNNRKASTCASVRQLGNQQSAPARTPSRSRVDLACWAAELYAQWGFSQEYGFHVIGWEHDPWCPLNPDHGLPSLWSCCECQPNAWLVLHVGTPRERRIEVLRDGIPVPPNHHAH
jgi:hypothetical protein